MKVASQCSTRAGSTRVYLTYFIKMGLARIEGPTQVSTEVTFEAFTHSKRIKPNESQCMTGSFPPCHGRRKGWTLPPGFKNLTFSYYIFSKKRSFRNFEWEKLKFTTFGPPGKIFLATSGKIHYWPSPRKTPSDAYAPCPFIKGGKRGGVAFLWKYHR